MMKRIVGIVRSVLARAGWELTARSERERAAIVDLPEADQAIALRVAPFTLTGIERRASLLQAVDYLVRQRIEGDIGGAGAAGARRRHAPPVPLRHLRGHERAHCRRPQRERRDGRSAARAHDARRRRLVRSRHRRRARQPRFHRLPGRTSALRAGQGRRHDHGWYESTRHELQHLYPRLAPGGVLIIDDYGHWQGARKAVDEYFAGSAVYLHRVDYTARLLIKPFA